MTGSLHPTSRADGPATARLLLVVALALAWLVALAVPASAHASLIETSPPDGTRLEAAPEQVLLRFSEAVSSTPDGIRVFDADATRVDAGERETVSPTEVAVALPADLPDGGYVVTFRVISADSHPVAGTFTFVVGDGEQVDDALVADLFGGAGQEWTGVVGPLLRGASYLGVLLAAGAAAFSAWVAARREERDVAWTWAVRGAVLAAVTSLLAVPVQTVAVTGRSLAGVFASGGGLGDTLVFSSFGQSTLLRLVALAAFVVAWQRLDRGRGGAGSHLEVLVTGALAAGSFVLDGHQRAVEPTWLLIGADLVHLLGAALWVGGLVLLLGAVRRRRIDDDPVGAAGLVSRFSRLALWSVLALTVAGVAMSGVLVRTPRALTATGYGWTLVAKVGLVALVLLAAAYNRWRLEPAIAARVVPTGGAVDVGAETTDRVAQRSRRAWGQLRTTLAIEVIGVAAVVAVTGFLVSQRPAAEAAGITGAYQTTVALTEDLDVDLVVDPNRAGLNALHVYVLDETGRPVGDVEDLRLELTYVPEQIGPIEVVPYVAGPGHWSANIEDLRFAGEWEVRVVAGIDRFTQADVRVPVVVNAP
ncbi:copper resistance CopC/CopD family protein [Egicoccus halophilus]|uniref:Copper resistance protein C n=1 Tax=Egicoccus halophilus TaxID=1670830 RepID=A0A8J3A4Z1_9ACTN|nr:copper resistance protein CopC [Egicoccus halophilus]GGI02932.1 copper resistance protein C [Egicoccus halophilus]